MSELLEIKSLVEDQGRAWEEFKAANDARLKAIEEKGFAPADLEEKVTRLNDELNRLHTKHDEIAVKLARPGAGNDRGKDDAEKMKAFSTYLRKGDIRELEAVESKALESWSDPDGGVLVPSEMDSMIDRVVPTISAMARLARTVTIGAGSWKKVVKTSGLSMRWVSDGAAGGETSNASYAEIEIAPYVAEVEPWVHNTTLEDAFIDLAADLEMEAGIGFGEGLGAAYITGNGVGRPRGITKYTAVANASYTWGSVGYIAAGAAGGFTTSAPGDKIIQLQHALKQQYRPGSAFLMPDSVLSTVRQMKDGSGQYYLWQPDPTSGFGGRILGTPVEIDDNMPAIAANSYSIAIGNWPRAYACVNRRGTSLIRDNLTSKGKTKFNFTRRAGGGIYNFEALKLMKFATG